MVQYRRPSCSSWTESVRSSFGMTIMGKATWENPIATRLGESFQLGMLIRTPSKKLFLSVYVDDVKLAGKKQNIVPMWKLFNKEVDLGEPTSFLDHGYLGYTQRQCEISKDIVDNEWQSHVGISNFRGRNWKTSVLWVWAFFFMVLCYGRSCEEMCGTILWVGK